MARRATLDFDNKGWRERGGGFRAETEGERGGCMYEGRREKRSLFYSGGARPAIWSYKINHSSLRSRGRRDVSNKS